MSKIETTVPSPTRSQFFALQPFVIKVMALEIEEMKNKIANGQTNMYPIRFDRLCPPRTMSTNSGNKNQLATVIIVAETNNPKSPNKNVKIFFIFASLLFACKNCFVILQSDFFCRWIESIDVIFVFTQHFVFCDCERISFTY